PRRRRRRDARRSRRPARRARPRARAASGRHRPHVSPASPPRAALSAPAVCASAVPADTESVPVATLAVATRDRAPLVRRFLVPLAGLAAGRGWDVVVVDQSVNGATQALLEPLDGVRYLRSEPGLSRARNVAIGASTTPIVAFCDDDVEVAACWFDEVL